LKEEYSIGGVLFHKKECLLLKYGMGHWGLVKGNVEDEETKEETILRELREETGIANAEIIEDFEAPVEYYYTLKGDKIHKRVDYLLLRSPTKEVTLSYEHDDYEWLPFEKAIQKVDYQDVKNVLKKALSLLKEKNLFEG